MATITSNSSGNWATGSTWVGGSVPAADDLVVIAHGHKVTLNTNIQSTRTGNVTIDGNLHFANGGKMHLHGLMRVNNTSNSNNTAGEFVEGTSTSGSLLSMANGTEIKISGNNGDQHGIQVHSRKWCGVQIDGGEPTLITTVNGNHDPDSSYIAVADASNFAINDRISLYKREEDYTLVNDEVFFVHDVDTTNDRIYFRQYVCPEATIQSVSGSTITVSDASVFRVNYLLIFGTGNNRNVLRVTAINKNTITFGSTVDNDPSLVGAKVYQTGTEKYHINGKFCRRIASAIATEYVGATNLRTITLNDVTDFSVGDEVYIHASFTKYGGNLASNYYYTSSGFGSTSLGGNEGIWRLKTNYTISSIDTSAKTITVDRDILFNGAVGDPVVKMTRDVVIKACDTSGNDVADGDQDTARVFFSVRYWTSTSWYNAPTRRVKIKYVQFKGLGYNTNDSTNYRAGVTIAGYNGYYDTTRDGSSADSSTIHSTSGVTQTGENYIDGCTFSSYNLNSNDTRDGDDYPSICIRHPYGMVTRNLVSIGAGRGIWHWSTQYFNKSHGHITAHCSYTTHQIEAGYEMPNEYSYGQFYGSEDYGLMLYNIGRQNDQAKVMHMRVENQRSYAFYFGGSTISPNYRRFFANRYKQLCNLADSNNNVIVDNSKVYPNDWDATMSIYGKGTGIIYPNTLQSHGSSHLALRRGGTGWKGTYRFTEQGFKENEEITVYYNFTHFRGIKGLKSDLWVPSWSSNPNAFGVIKIPANCTVAIKSVIYIPTDELDGTGSSLSSSHPPYIVASYAHNMLYGANEYDVNDNNHRFPFDDLDLNDSAETVDLKNSTQAQGKLYQGFIEYTQHTTAADGAWETKTLTVQPQYRSYFLRFGYYHPNHSLVHEGFYAKDLQIALSVAPPNGVEMWPNNFAKVTIRPSANFSVGRKRISGRI
jgi:fructose-specific component phosphotransferase system IIB-like protein